MKYLGWILIFIISCGENEHALESKDGCASKQTKAKTDQKGIGNIFNSDPKTGSRFDQIKIEDDLNRYTVKKEIENLDGTGRLSGKNVQVVSGLYCNQKFHAFDQSNDFSYYWGHESFEEVMGYFYGDQYLSFIEKLGIKNNFKFFKLDVHCNEPNNAYFTTKSEKKNQYGFVCLGNSSLHPKAFYAQDAQVIIHEIQHGITLSSYSDKEILNQFTYDEAGVLNEGISDFTSLVYFDDESNDYRKRFFSPWALGGFSVGENRSRTVIPCPRDAIDFPKCSSFHSGDFSYKEKKVFYAYPDGLGLSLSGQEILHNIHKNSVIASGALFDVYLALKKHYGLDIAKKKSISLVHSVLKALPKPWENGIKSPVTLVIFFAEISKQLEKSENESVFSDVVSVLKKRGFLKSKAVTGAWVKFKNYKVVDSITRLSRFAHELGFESEKIDQFKMNNDGILNSEESALVYLNFENISLFTAGGIQVNVKIDSNLAQFIKGPLNEGYVNEKEVQFQIAKINGNQDIFQFGNTFFETDPFFLNTPERGLWIKTNSFHQRSELSLIVSLNPSNGDTEVLNVGLDMVP